MREVILSIEDPHLETLFKPNPVSAILRKFKTSVSPECSTQEETHMFLLSRGFGIVCIYLVLSLWIVGGLIFQPAGGVPRLSSFEEAVEERLGPRFNCDKKGKMTMSCTQRGWRWQQSKFHLHRANKTKQSTEGFFMVVH